MWLSIWVQNFEKIISELGHNKGELLASQIKLPMFYSRYVNPTADLVNAFDDDLCGNEQRR